MYLINHKMIEETETYSNQTEYTIKKEFYSPVHNSRTPKTVSKSLIASPIIYSSPSHSNKLSLFSKEYPKLVKDIKQINKLLLPVMRKKQYLTLDYLF